MTLGCPYCHVPADLPEFLFEARRKLGPQELAIFDMLWRRMPAGATREEICSEIEYRGSTFTEASYLQALVRLRKAGAGLFTLKLERSRYRYNPLHRDDPDNQPIYKRVHSWSLVVPGWDRALRT